MNVKKIKAFTLAEVLITLAIIGVIAAISVPSLIQKTNQAELKTSWKKAFATLSQAMDQYVFENGSFDGKCATNRSNCFANALTPYLKTISTVHGNNAAAVANCWSGDLPGNLNEPHSCVILNSGMIIDFDMEYGDCSPTNANPRCGWINVDVNGFKNPNTYGKDRYVISVLQDSITPGLYWKTNPDACKDGSGLPSDNYGCSSVYLYK